MENNGSNYVNVFDIDLIISKNGGDSLQYEFYNMLENGMNCSNYIDIIYNNVIRIVEENFFKIRTLFNTQDLTNYELKIMISNMIASYFLDLSNNYFEFESREEIDCKVNIYDMIYENYSYDVLSLNLKQTRK